MLTVRAYTAPAVSLVKLSDHNKQKRILMERKGIEKVIFYGTRNQMTLYKGGEEESFVCKYCCVEVVDEEPDDGLADGSPEF